MQYLITRQAGLGLPKAYPKEVTQWRSADKRSRFLCLNVYTYCAYCQRVGSYNVQYYDLVSLTKDNTVLIRNLVTLPA